MIDLHCHLLPGLDFGPRDLKTALMLARQAVEDGVTHCVATPQIRVGRWAPSKFRISEALMAFKLALAESNIHLTVGAGAAVRICPESLTMLSLDEIPYLGFWENKKVALIEFPSTHIHHGTEKAVGWLMAKGIQPLIAHPERNQEIVGSLDKIYPLVDCGCLFQLTSGSLLGEFGDQVKNRAETLLSMGIITVMSSGAHHPKLRPVNLRRGFHAAAKIIGESKAKKLVYENPIKIASRKFTVGNSGLLDGCLNN